MVLAKKKHLRHFRGEDQPLSSEYGRYPAGLSRLRRMLLQLFRVGIRRMPA
jgi:hypothetical protein